MLLNNSNIVHFMCKFLNFYNKLCKAGKISLYYWIGPSGPTKSKVCVSIGPYRIEMKNLDCCRPSGDLVKDKLKE